MVPSSGAIAKLRRVLRHTSELQGAANECFNTLRWLSVHSVGSIPVLDFDVICGALPSAALEMAAETASGLHDDLVPPLVGPHTVRLILKSSRDICLPIGTVAELLERVATLKKSLSARAQSFLETISKLRDPGAVSSLARQISLEEFPELLFQELSGYEQNAEDVTLLSSLLSRNTPFEQLVGHERETKNIDAFKATLHYLDDERHWRPHQNLFDAYNVACAVEIFNNPSERGPKRRIPLFISDTERLTSWSLNPWLRKADVESLPDLSHNRLFLVFYQGLVARNYGALNIAQDEAGLLTSELTSIADVLKNLLHKAHSIVTHRGLAENDLQLADLPEPTVLRLQHKVGRLTSTWNDVLQPVAKSEEYDRVHYLNQFVRPHFLKAINTQGSERAMAVHAIISGIDRFRREHHTFWELIQEHANSRPYEVSQVSFSSLVEVSFTVNDGSLLSETRPGFDRAHALRKWGAGWTHEVATAAHIRISPEALMSSYRTEFGHIAVRWTHNVELRKLIALSFRFFENTEGRAKSILTRCYSCPGIHSTQIDSSMLLADTFPAQLTDAEYLEFEGNGGVVLFADKEPIDGEEKQIGVVAHPKALKSPVIIEIGRMVAMSSFMPLSEELAAYVVPRLLESIEVANAE
jgi:hypothetical protein